MGTGGWPALPSHSGKDTFLVTTWLHSRASKQRSKSLFIVLLWSLIAEKSKGKEEEEGGGGGRRRGQLNILCLSSFPLLWVQRLTFPHAFQWGADE